MNYSLIEILMTVLILACVFMGAVFIAHQKKGQTFIESFDKAVAWGSGLFVIGGCLGTVAYLG